MSCLKYFKKQTKNTTKKQQQQKNPTSKISGIWEIIILIKMYEESLPVWYLNI